MPLKSVLEKVDDLPKEIQGLYEKGADNKYYLGVEGMVASTRIDEFRSNNLELKKSLERYEGIDPEKYRKMVEEENKRREKKLLDAGDVDKVVAERVATMKTEFETNLANLTKANEGLNARLSSVLIDSTVKSAAVAAGVMPSAVDDVVLRAKSTFQVKDGNVVAVKANGELMYGKDGVTPLTIEEWVGSLKTTATHLFEGMRGSGAGGARPGPGGVDTSKMTATQKIAAGLAQGHGRGTQPAGG